MRRGMIAKPTCLNSLADAKGRWWSGERMRSLGPGMLMQQNYTQRLVIGGDFDAAHVWLRQELARPERSPYDDEILRAAVCDSYRKQARWADRQKGQRTGSNAVRRVFNTIQRTVSISRR